MNWLVMDVDGASSIPGTHVIMWHQKPYQNPGDNLAICVPRGTHIAKFSCVELGYIFFNWVQRQLQNGTSSKRSLCHEEGAVCQFVFTFYWFMTIVTSQNITRLTSNLLQICGKMKHKNVHAVGGVL